ncbi:UbiX family flavin prenyltransferase [uncultured Helicobacter sp.]|uniref:UbiX family flavin prenyltransferase n=1 Tax=uncultured Helicobacter sp. TaxID=175537 RepID=UPI001C3AA90E|nr:UbiX family flavin prenyltransferase [Candidatus Helicobacter avicola]
MMSGQYPKKLVVGISGASGVHLGIEFVRYLPSDIAVYVVVSNGAQCVYANEPRDSHQTLEGALCEVRAHNLKIFSDEALHECIASGSSRMEAMCIIPASCDVVAKIAMGVSDTLITRSASVMLKEGRKLLLGVREMPFSAIMLENMLKLSRLGVCIAPPIVGYYGGAKSLEQMEQFFVGKWYDVLGIPHRLFTPWDDDARQDVIKVAKQ